ncbi:MAG TPA: cytochrome P460 family protein, partial [Puia sp.]|nr:cytochrome P460 family protein [Puia sp.]
IDGRNVLNFSEWDQLSPADQAAKMWESVNQIIAEAMPLSEYTFVHRSARISSEDLQVLKNYVAGIPVYQASDSQKTETLRQQILHEKEYQERKVIPVALNGIAFIPDYKNWQPVSSTERYDNGTLRVIVGNDIAIKAIADGNANPWPDGTIFGKITWDALKDSLGFIRTGPFKQVEFMIRDSKKYGATRNWGFARFKTAAMLPYGQNILFTSECVNCHQPMKEHDFVFTIPFKFPFDSREFNLKSSFVNPKDSTMSILYGGKGIFRLATWKQKPDDHWFGGNVPGNLVSVDTVGEISHEKLSVLP